MAFTVLVAVVGVFLRDAFLPRQLLPAVWPAVPVCVLVRERRTVDHVRELLLVVWVVAFEVRPAAMSMPVLAAKCAERTAFRLQHFVLYLVFVYFDVFEVPGFRPHE